MDNSLLRALVIGGILAGGGIGLFLLLYFVVMTNAESLVRLMTSLLIPPLIMALLVGGYFIITQDEKSDL